MDLNNLKKEIPYKFKPGRMNNKTGKQSPEMAYIDARDVMDLLDEVCGQDGWQSDYKVLDGKMYAGIGINVGSLTQPLWVWKWDMGVESDFEAEKGEASDAFKRAAVKWGVGRFLYDLKPGYKATPKIIINKGMAVPVVDIETPKKEFDPVTIEPEIEFNLDGELPKEPMKKTNPPAQTIKGKLICGCGREITPTVEKFSTKEFGRPLCMVCQMKERKNAQEVRE
jgi:hypothetical protein